MQSSVEQQSRAAAVIFLGRQFLYYFSYRNIRNINFRYMKKYDGDGDDDDDDDDDDDRSRNR